MSRVCVNAASPVPTACAWKPVTRHRRRTVGVPGRAVDVWGGVLRECTLRNFHRQSHGSVCNRRSSVAVVVGARPRITRRRVSFPHVPPLHPSTANVADNNKNNASPRQNSAVSQSCARASCPPSVNAEIVIPIIFQQPSVIDTI